jgi:arsenite methyltransferase
VNTCALEHPYQAGRHDSGTPLRPGGTELTLRALQCAGFAPGQRVLDLGCGVGIATRLLRRHGCQAFGVDLAVHRLALARREDPALALVAADGRRLPFADQSLDGILAECSLSLIGYSAATLAECRRVLRPGGRLAITDLYSRAQPGAEAVGAVAGCLGGMVTRNAMLAALAAAGAAPAALGGPHRAPQGLRGAAHLLGRRRPGLVGLRRPQRCRRAACTPTRLLPARRHPA